MSDARAKPIFYIFTETKGLKCEIQRVTFLQKKLKAGLPYTWKQWIHFASMFLLLSCSRVIKLWSNVPWNKNEKWGICSPETCQRRGNTYSSTSFYKFLLIVSYDSHSLTSFLWANTQKNSYLHQAPWGNSFCYYILSFFLSAESQSVLFWHSVAITYITFIF